LAKSKKAPLKLAPVDVFKGAADEVGGLRRLPRTLLCSADPFARTEGGRMRMRRGRARALAVGPTTTRDLLIGRLSSATCASGSSRICPPWRSTSKPPNCTKATYARKSG